MLAFNMSNGHVFTASTERRGPFYGYSSRPVQYSVGVRVHMKVCVSVCVFNLSPSYRTNNWKQIMLQVKEQPVISSNGPSAAPK